MAVITHLQKVEEVTGKTPPELKEYYDITFPDNLLSYWNDFLELNKKRSRTEEGDSSLSFVEIDAWSRLVGVPVSQFWLDVIEMLDQCWLRQQAKK